jgi:hypothetical protein
MAAPPSSERRSYPWVVIAIVLVAIVIVAAVAWIYLTEPTQGTPSATSVGNTTDSSMATQSSTRSTQATSVTLPQIWNGTDTSAPVVLLNYTIDGDTSAIIVQNVGNRQIVGLTGRFPGFPPVEFATPAHRSIGSLVPFYPLEFAYNFTVYKQNQTNFVLGERYDFGLQAAFRGGGSVNESFSMISSPPLNVRPGYTCGEPSGSTSNPLKWSEQYVVDNSSRVNWSFSIKNSGTEDIIMMMVGVNNGTMWSPFQYGGKPVTPSNAFPVGANLTQAFSWTLAPNSVRYFEYMCSDLSLSGEFTILPR